MEILRRWHFFLAQNKIAERHTLDSSTHSMPHVASRLEPNPYLAHAHGRGRLLSCYPSSALLFSPAPTLACCLQAVSAPITSLSYQLPFVRRFLALEEYPPRTSKSQ